MFIEELIIEGFKSYATRTVISGWDPEFNAITGLNGSGKSNILDSICFVLGISTLSHVRATNLQDLVYKRGQAGITKASVTIVFNNEDRSKSPPGYENHKQLSVTRQIVVNGRNKYIVNGHNKNQQDVANLFQSVQLNVNNPHFLIMQGRITKVLNMKPPEILAMIEEAAGTRMFEDRKEKAFKTMAKKDAKLDEITQLLLTEIEPKLEKLRESKRTFLEFKKLAADLDQLCRWQVALEYMKYEAKLEASGQDLQEKEERLVTLDEMQKTVGEELQVIDRQIAQIAAARENDSSQLKSLENTYKEKSKDLIRIKTQCDLKASTVVEERKNWDGLLKEKLETEQALEASKAKYQKLSTNYEATLNSHRDQTEEVRRKEELVQSLSTGLATNDGQDSGYQGQLQEANKAISTANSAAEQAKLKINHLKKELHAKMPKAKAAEKQNSSLVAELRSNEKIVAMLENELQGLMRDPDRAQDLLRQKQAAQATVNSLRQQVESLERELSSFQFSYSDPVPNFDRRKVKGLVAELVNIPKQNEGAAAALEVCAGGRLYNVVVDTEVVGSQLLQHGRLRRRVTIIPLNKISTFRVQAERIATARKVAPGKCDLALNLVGYAEDVERAMNYVFGSTLICNDSDTAKKVTFDKNVRLRSITLEGDTYDPSGQLSGGSRANSAGNLLKLSTLNECRHKLAEHEKELVTITQLLEECERTESHYGGLEQKLGLKRHEGALLKERLSTNSNAQVIRQVEELVQELNQQEELRQQATEKKAEATERRTKIEQEMKEFTLHRDDKLKSMQKSHQAEQS
ncbi:SMC2 protein [Phlyctochytrium arcticum]|nr:SMC2 protein [Phlyctochytrium arcticum]